MCLKENTKKISELVEPRVLRLFIFINIDYFHFNESCMWILKQHTLKKQGNRLSNLHFTENATVFIPDKQSYCSNHRFNYESKPGRGPTVNKHGMTISILYKTSYLVYIIFVILLSWNMWCSKPFVTHTIPHTKPL